MVLPFCSPEATAVIQVAKGDRGGSTTLGVLQCHSCAVCPSNMCITILGLGFLISLKTDFVPVQFLSFYSSMLFFFLNQQDKTNVEVPKMLIKMEILVFQSALATGWYQFWGRHSYSFRTLTAGNNFTLERYSSYGIIWI